MEQKRTPPMPDMKKIIRLVISSVIFAAAILLPDGVKIVKLILLIVAAGAAVYDTVLRCVDCVESKNYFSTPVLLTAVAFTSIVIGFAKFSIAIDGAAMCIIYFAGTLVLDYAVYGTELSVGELTRYHEEDITEKLDAIFDADDAFETETAGTVSASAGKVLRYAMIFAIVFAILVPIITSFMGFSESLHRALMIIIVCTPTSIATSLRFVAKMSLSSAASHGVLFENAAHMEDASYIDTVVIDKAGIYTSNSPRIVSAKSDVIDAGTFMNFVSHAVYYSEQAFAKAISAAYDKEYKLEVISNFKDVPGAGVELDIAGSHVVLGTNSLLNALGLSVPQASVAGKGSSVYYLVIANKYIGYIEIADELNSEAYSLVSGLKENGVGKCVLLTDDNAEDSEEFAASLDFDSVYSECDGEKKQNIISQYQSSSRHGVAYIYANSAEVHSDALVDVRVSRKARYADAVAIPSFVSEIPEAFSVCKRMRQVTVFNAVFAYAVKVLIIFLSIIGSCSLWFAVLLDAVATAGTVLLSVRVTKESPLNAFIYRYSVDKDEQE